MGHVSDVEAATGCTVILCSAASEASAAESLDSSGTVDAVEEAGAVGLNTAGGGGAAGTAGTAGTSGAVAAVAVRGGAPATRETDLLAPENMVQGVHAVVLSGGSAFGLDACSGVMRYLEEQGTGFAFTGAVVPIVVGASLFDLDLGTATRRPDNAMGYAAAASAAADVAQTGCIGAGTGASVGRFMGIQHAMKGGLGVASVQSGELLVTAVVAVNSLGTIYDRQACAYIAGACSKQEGKRVIVEPLDMLPLIMSTQPEGRTNTTIGAVLTNASLSKTQAHRVASMAHDGLARAIYPVHTSFDGDALFTVATGEVASQPDLVGALAALVVEQAVLDAVLSADEAYGLPSALSLEGENLQA